MPQQVEKIFLGWTQPALYSATELLVDRCRNGEELDMSRLLILVPGKQAGRRLGELLALRVAELAEDAPLRYQPPCVVTPENLPEQLFTHDIRVCSDLEMGLARYHAVRRAKRDELATLFPSLPGEEDFDGWMRVARETGSIAYELAGDDLTHEFVRQQCQQNHLDHSAGRWKVLEEVESSYRALLDSAGCEDTHGVRRKVLDCGAWNTELRVVLLGTVDLPRLTKRILQTFADCATWAPLILVNAPEEHNAGFDDWGCLRPEYWSRQNVGLQAEQIAFVAQPADQLESVTQWLRELPGEAPGKATIGLGDESLGGALVRYLERQGYAARQGAGKPMAATGPFTLLRLLASFAQERRPEQFAALVRHPDLEEHLHAVGVGQGAWEVPAAWDNYMAEHLPVRVGAGKYLGSGRGDTEAPEGVLDESGTGAGQGYGPVMVGLKGTARTAVMAVERLVTPLEGRLWLADWAPRLRELFATVYAFLPERAATPQREEVVEALRCVGGFTDKIDELTADHPLAAEVTFAELAALMLAEVSRVTVPPPGGEPAIELVGWLDMQLDDAPYAAVLGYTEGLIPDSVNAHAFLPDTLRRNLGLNDNLRRYARDVFFTNAIAAVRANADGRALVVSPQLSPRGDRLTPSRLLFACDDAELVRRAQEFYAEPEADGAQAGRPELGAGRILRPLAPAGMGQPLQKLRVTAFRDYLASPYRFYLKHVLGLKSVGDDAVELGADVFGNLLHSVLQSYGARVLAECDGVFPADAALSEQWLTEFLDAQVTRDFGRQLLPAVEFQLHQLRRRLAGFARLQAQLAAEGWRLQNVETAGVAQIEVDGQPFELTGRIDRIDYHPETGAIRVVDYKSGDSGATPEKTHRDKKHPTGWKDLQLPLYLLFPEVAGRPAELGYIVLPQDVDGVSWVAANWDAEILASAHAAAEDVIRKLRQQLFWPPGDTPTFEDGLEGLCFDRVLHRDELLGHPAEQEYRWEQRWSKRLAGWRLPLENEPPVSAIAEAVEMNVQGEAGHE